MAVLVEPRSVPVFDPLAGLASSDPTADPDAEDTLRGAQAVERVPGGVFVSNHPAVQHKLALLRRDLKRMSRADSDPFVPRAPSRFRTLWTLWRASRSRLFGP